jgi:vancomycin resistance protein YoaR
MKISWIIGLLLFSQVNNPNNEIQIHQNGNTIAIVESSDYILPLQGGPFLNVHKYNQFLEKIEQQLYKAPLNAMIDNDGNIHPEQTGIKLDRHAFTTKIYHSFFHSGPNIIEVPTLSLFPQVDSELLSSIYEKRIGQYITYFNAKNEKRSYNIFLAAEAINNQVIFPG